MDEGFAEDNFPGTQARQTQQRESSFAAFTADGIGGGQGREEPDGDEDSEIHFAEKGSAEVLKLELLRGQCRR